MFKKGCGYVSMHLSQTDAFRVEIDHADGSMNALQKNKKLIGLNDMPNDTCRILSNARFNRRVDVPDLDAVMFHNRIGQELISHKQLDNAKGSGKEYGYIVLPIEFR